MRRRARSSRPRSITPPLAPRERHRVGVRSQVLPSADPHAVVPVVVLAARGRAHRAQLGMDARAVHALLVVLDDQLPVGGDLVRVGAADRQALRLVRRDPVLETVEEAVQRRCRSGDVDHRPAVPLLDRDRCETVQRAVEAVGRLEVRCRQQRTVEPVPPAVVRALDRALVVGRAARHQLVGAVTAGVEEAAQHAVGAAHEHDLVVGDGDGDPRPRRVELDRPPGAHPGAGEQVRTFPGEDAVVAVRGGRQHAAAHRRIEHVGELDRVDHRRIDRLTHGGARPTGAPQQPAPGGGRTGSAACTATPGCRSRRRRRASPTSTGTGRRSAS